MEYSIDIDDVFAAAGRLDGIVKRTPVVSAEGIDKVAGRQVLLKCENLQYVGAFKFRGATNAVIMLGDAAENGVCTHSSGNHAQALSMAAKNRGVDAFIVMPKTAPRVKVLGVKNQGAEITFCEPTLAAREAAAGDIIDRTGAALVHPYDNPDVMAGQGTAALEFFQQAGHLDAIVSPVGGGGLMSGTSITTRAMNPDARIFGAEPEGADDAARSLEAGEFLPQTGPNTICDGLLTSMGEHTWPIIKDHLEAIIRVSDEQVIEAMRLILDNLGMVVEPSGAASLAAVLTPEFQSLEGIDKVGVILSGGNVDSLPF
ncbi:MAG: pyridoxal-phosphate dependent enzyme [Candidatus Thermoplasmatota archaeon]|nr:pyridoxal-phosphate dependent enzyme [Candidatus Thermoplasmatota archaeon]MEE3315586.1 pyridoxal-phosphate dependent enzyme [Candidatus Thermoplasmatota archaeon]